MLRRTAVRLMARRGGLRRRHAEAVPELLPVDPRAFEDTLMFMPIDAEVAQAPSPARPVDVPFPEPSRSRLTGGGMVA